MKKKIQLITSLLALCFVLSTSSINLVSATDDEWVTLESMPTERYWLGVAVVNGKIYAIGGYSNGGVVGTNEMYDPETNTWTTKEPMPTARAAFGIAVYQNKIHVMGGYVPYDFFFSQAHEVYDPVTDTWETKSGTEFSAFFCANVVNDKLYVMGGQRQVFYPHGTIEQNMLYDPLTDSWTDLTPMPTGVSDYTSAVIDNKIYVMGGRSGSVTAENILTQIYDPETDAWSTGAQIPSIVFDAAAGATSGEFALKRIYVVGGIDYSKRVSEELSSLYDPEATSDLTQIYDPETDIWTTGAPMLTSRYGLGVAVIDDKIYAIGGKKGGETYPTEYYSKNEMYTPQGYIPEFPSWIVMPLFIMASVAVIIYRKKLTKKIAC
jgi:N-acetylneuraminic acid mutarotase